MSGSGFRSGSGQVHPQSDLLLRGGDAVVSTPRCPAGIDRLFHGSGHLVSTDEHTGAVCRMQSNDVASRSIRGYLRFITDVRKHLKNGKHGRCSENMWCTTSICFRLFVIDMNNFSLAGNRVYFAGFISYRSICFIFMI